MTENKRRAASPSPIETAFLKYERAIRRTIRRITKSRDDIDDIAQESFLRAVVAERRRPIENTKAYLFATARNIALNDIAKKSRSILEIVEDVTALEHIDERPSVDQAVVSRERFATFCEAVATLPPQCRKVFLMCKVHGKSHREIGRSLGISESTVEKHVGMALARCTAYLQASESEEATGTASVAKVRLGSAK